MPARNAGAVGLREYCHVIREITRGEGFGPGTAMGVMLRQARERVAAEIAPTLRVSQAEAESIIHTSAGAAA